MASDMAQDMTPGAKPFTFLQSEQSFATVALSHLLRQRPTGVILCGSRSTFGASPRRPAFATRIQGETEWMSSPPPV